VHKLASGASVKFKSRQQHNDKHSNSGRCYQAAGKRLLKDFIG